MMELKELDEKREQQIEKMRQLEEDFQKILKN